MQATSGGGRVETGGRVDMARAVPGQGPDDRRALLGLWSIQGVGPKGIARLGAELGPLAGLLDVPLASWIHRLRLSPATVRRLTASHETLGSVADQVLERCERAGISVCFPADAAWPPGLRGRDDLPPLLFHRGPATAPGRMVAVVGSRRPEPAVLLNARRFVARLARGGAGIVSGAALGVDQAAHLGALDAGMPTWAFLGSALDEMDPAQARMVPAILEGGGIVYSELPPGVRASRQTFPRRNRLIAGSADAVLVLRAGFRSGSLYTAVAALGFGRPVLAWPGEWDAPLAEGCNRLLRSGHASVCLEPSDVWRAMGLPGALEGRPRPPASWADEVSASARRTYAVLERAPHGYEELLAKAGLSSAALSATLCELELQGLVIQHPGRRYQKV